MSLRPSIVVLATLLFASQRGSPASFDTLFTGATMRVDYFHTGGPKSGETVSLDRVVNDGDQQAEKTRLNRIAEPERD